MSGLFGAKSQKISTSAPVITGFRLQTSAFGRPIAWVFGRTRIAANLLDYDGFKAIPHTTTTSSGGGGGKGGGGGVTQENTTYTYQASVIMALARGPVVSLHKIWKGKELQTAEALALSFFTGDGAQAPFGFWTTNYAAKALGYRGIAYVAAGAYDLGDNAELPNHTFEVQAAAFSEEIVDADPKEVLTAILTEGLGWAGASIGTLTAFSDYCVANGLFVSPAYVDQESANEIIERLMRIGNAGVVWSEDKLKVVALGDQAVTGNGATFTPNLTPLYDLTDDDFLNDGDDEPVRVRRGTPEDAYNQVVVKFYNRANDYNEDQVTAQDLGNIQLYGLKAMEPVELHEICDRDIAQIAADTILRRELYTERNVHEFRLGWKHALLEPGDLITVPDPATGEKIAARLWTIDEDPVEGFQCEAKEFPFGTASAAIYGSQAAGGYNADFNVAPGNVNTPIMFVAPVTLTRNWLEIWIALSGGAEFGGCEIWCSEDDATYKRLGTFSGKSRMGVTTSTMNVVANPDDTTVLGVNLSQSKGELSSGVAADADNFNTLCYAGGELIAYTTATLTAANQYNLTGLRRGAYGSTPQIVAIGSPFARLDDAIFRYAFPPEWNGRTLYLKFPAFNRTGGGFQDIASLSPYEFTLSQDAVGLPVMPDIAGLALEGGGTSFTGRDAKFKWDEYALGDLVEPHTLDYKAEIWSDTGAGLALRRTEYVTSPRYAYTFEKNFEDHAGSPKRAFTLKMWRRGAFGDARQLSVNAAVLAVSNPVPALPSSVSLTASFKHLFFKHTPPADSDWAGLLIWRSTSTGFTPSEANLVYDGTDSIAVLAAEVGTSYYVRYAAYDTFGKTGLTVSGEITVTTGRVERVELVDDIINAAKLEDNAVGSSKILADAVTSVKLAAEAVTTSKLAVAAVTAAILAAGAVTTAKLALAAVTEDIIAASAVTSTKIADDSVTTPKLVAASVVTSKLAAGAVTANEIAASAVTAVKINAGAVTTEKLDAFAVTAAKIAAGTITANEIAASTITGAKIAAETIGASHIVSNSITTNKLLITSVGAALNADPGMQDLTAWQGFAGTKVIGASYNQFVTPDGVPDQLWQGRHIHVDTNRTYRLSWWVLRETGANGTFYARYATTDENDALTGDQVIGFDNVTPTLDTWVRGEATFVPAGTRITPRFYLNWTGTAGRYFIRDVRLEEVVPASLIVDGAIIAIKIAANAVTADKIAANQISASHMVADTITAGQIAADAVNTSEVAANAVTAAKITAGTITGDRIAASTITGDRINADTITVNHLQANSVTTAKLNDAAVSTTKIDTNAVTAGTAATAITAVTGQGDVITVSFTTTGRPLLVTGILSWRHQHNTADSSEVRVQLFRDTTQIASQEFHGTSTQIGDAESSSYVSASVTPVQTRVTLAAGTYTFKLKLVFGGSGTIKYWNRSINVVELKR